MLNMNVNYAGPKLDYASDMETMGDRIRMLREAKRYTQTELGREVGVTKSAVSQWENGQTANIKLQTFLRLLDVLGTKYEYLIYGAARSPAGDGARSRATGSSAENRPKGRSPS